VEVEAIAAAEPLPSDQALDNGELVNHPSPIDHA